MLLLLCIVLIAITVLLTVVLYTLMERQVMASMQRRIGPSVAGPFGVWQSVYDGLKLGLKEPILLEVGTLEAFILAPVTSFILSQIAYCALLLTDSPYQGLALMAISSLGIYGIVLSGWASNSKYAFLGSIRSVSIMISYELGFGVMLLCISLFLVDSQGQKSLCFEEVGSGIHWALLPVFICYIISILAETKRTPFDLPESESELVAGYNVEYSSLWFALFFISEYTNMCSMCLLGCFYLLGSWSLGGLLFLLLSFIWIRATLPRYRYDQFLRLGWKTLLPISLSLYSIYAVFDYITP